MRREAIFARQGWYPEDKIGAGKMLDEFLKSDAKPTEAIAVVCPHAGWVFSGATAGKVYAGVVVPDRVILLCPMHRAGGPPISLWAKGEWNTPLGEIGIDEEFCSRLLESGDMLREDYESQRMEHAIEIQLPFIRARNPDARIVPLRIGHLRWKDISSLASLLAEKVAGANGKTLLVASTDMSHEADYDLVKRNDAIARDRIINLDAIGLCDAVEEHGITMCGYIPTAVVVETAKILGAMKSSEVAYTNSADVSGRRDYVVGYLGARID